MSIAIKNVITRKLVFLADKQVILYSKYLFISMFALLLISFTGIPEIKPAFYYSITIASVTDIVV